MLPNPFSARAPVSKNSSRLAEQNELLRKKVVAFTASGQ
jgi:hypothetical protein